MEGYKYIIFLCFFIFSCEKNNSINDLETILLCNEWVTELEPEPSNEEETNGGQTNN